MFTFVVSYYLNLKQKHLLHKMHQINQSIETNSRSVFFKVLQINKKFVDFTKELSLYNPYIRRCLSVYCITFMSVVSCCTFMLLMTKSAIEFKILFFVIDSVHIILLALVIYFCSKLPSGQCLISKQSYNTLSSMITKQCYDHRYIFKVIYSKATSFFSFKKLTFYSKQMQTVWQNTEGAKCGFTLINSYLINKTSYFVVSIH